MPDNKNQGQGQGKKIQGAKSSREIERENMDQVSNDNDLDQDLDEDLEEGEITQRNPRVGDQGEQGQRQVDRGGQGGMDRDRNRE